MILNTSLKHKPSPTQDLKMSLSPVKRGGQTVFPSASHFTKTSNTIVRSDISDRLMRIILLMKSGAERWRWTFERLQEHLGYGRNSLYQALSEGIQRGYLVRVQRKVRGPSGYNSRVQYLLFEDRVKPSQIETLMKEHDLKKSDISWYGDLQKRKVRTTPKRAYHRREKQANNSNLRLPSFRDVCRKKPVRTSSYVSTPPQPKDKKKTEKANAKTFSKSRKRAPSGAHNYPPRGSQNEFDYGISDQTFAQKVRAGFPDESPENSQALQTAVREQKPLSAQKPGARAVAPHVYLTPEEENALRQKIGDEIFEGRAFVLSREREASIMRFRKKELKRGGYSFEDNLRFIYTQRDDSFQITSRWVGDKFNQLKSMPGYTRHTPDSRKTIRSFVKDQTSSLKEFIYWDLGGDLKCALPGARIALDEPDFKKKLGKMICALREWIRRQSQAVLDSVKKKIQEIKKKLSLRGVLQ